LSCLGVGKWISPWDRVLGKDQLTAANMPANIGVAQQACARGAVNEDDEENQEKQIGKRR
jgi:hypothetical protein